MSRPKYGRDLGLLYYFFAFKVGAPFFRAAHRAFMAAASFALPSGVIPPLLFLAGFEEDLAAEDWPLDLAHLRR